MNADAVNKKLPESSLISAYLTSLERALAQSEDRDEIVASVREHIADALSAEEDVPDPRAVRLVLDELGPVERIANLSRSPARLPAVGNRDCEYCRRS